MIYNAWAAFWIGLALIICTLIAGEHWHDVEKNKIMMECAEKRFEGGVCDNPA